MYLCIFMKKFPVLPVSLITFQSLLSNNPSTLHKIHKSSWDLQHLTSHLIRGNIYFFHKLFSELYYPQKSIKRKFLKQKSKFEEKYNFLREMGTREFIQKIYIPKHELETAN